MVVLCPQLLLLLLSCWSQGQFLTLLFLNWQVMKMGTFCSFFILLRLQVCPPTIQPFQGNQLLANIWMLWLLSSGTLLFIIPFAFAVPHKNYDWLFVVWKLSKMWKKRFLMSIISRRKYDMGRRRANFTGWWQATNEDQQHPFNKTEFRASSSISRCADGGDRDKMAPA